MNDLNIINAVKAAVKNPACIIEANSDKECTFKLEQDGEQRTITIQIISTFGEAKVDVIIDNIMIGGWHYEATQQDDFQRYLDLREQLSRAREARWNFKQGKKQILASWFWKPNQTF